MKALEEEERPTYFRRISKEILLVLYRPYPLYGYDFLRDSVFDAIRQYKISSLSFSRSYRTELISLAD